jgi:hypothetical protein
MLTASITSGEHHQRARQDEQDAGREAAAHAVQQPADVGGQFLRLRAGQQHAEIQRVQVARLFHPLLLVDQDPVHERDLAGRAAEAEAADLQPHAQRLAEARGAQARGSISPPAARQPSMPPSR